MAGNRKAPLTLKEEGSCDLSYSLAAKCRFRVNIFQQRGSYAIVMRVIPHTIPGFEELSLPEQLRDICRLKNGIVLVTGPTGSGKSSTLAAIIDQINTDRADHIVTIEDPIEFLHQHKKGTVHQRELHSDTPSFALALRAALRQAPKVILVGEMRDKETIEVALTAAETGHLVLSTLHTIDASKTVERVIGVFPLSDQQTIRKRLAASFRYFISQRLIPLRGGKGRVAAVEILKSTMRTREYIERGEGEGRALIDAIKDGDQEGMQHFDGEIERLIRAGVIDMETGIGLRDKLRQSEAGARGLRSFRVAIGNDAIGNAFLNLRESDARKRSSKSAAPRLPDSQVRRRAAPDCASVLACGSAASGCVRATQSAHKFP